MFYLIFILLAVGSKLTLADPPKLLTLQEIEQTIRDHAPIPALGVELFQIMTCPQVEPAQTVSGAAGNQLATISPSESTSLAIQRRFAVIGSTGDEASDLALEVARKRTLQIAMQAALHYRFQSDVAQPDANSDYKKGIEMLRAVLGKGADGVFDTLNHAYLFAWGKSQYELELNQKLRALLTRGLLSKDPNVRLRTLHAGLRLVPVESRTDFWKLGAKDEDTKVKDARMREFFGLRDSVQAEVYLEFLPRYLASAQPKQGAGVSRLISGTQLRDTRVVAQILNWKLTHVKTLTELVDLVWIELRDAAFSRFNSSGKLADPNANPIEAGKNESTPDLPDAEQLLFSDFFAYALVIADQKLEGQAGAFLEQIFQEFSQNTKIPIYQFVIETILFHIDQKFDEESSAGALTIKHAKSILLPLEEFLGPGNLTLPSRPWRAPLHDKTRYVLEEAILRQWGWFPPTPAVVTQAMDLLREELALGASVPLSHSARASLRLLTETPELFWAGVVDGATADPHGVLGDAEIATDFASCVRMILS